MTACVETYPQLEWLGRFHEDSRMWGDGAIPHWFEDWLNAEREATSLRIWQPLIVPGLLQTPDYARALCRAGTLSTGDEEVEQQSPPGWRGSVSSTGPTRRTCGSS